MGNHAAGELIAAFVEAEVAKRKPGDLALEVLDRAVAKAKSSSSFSPDVELEATHPTDKGVIHPIIVNWDDPHPLAPLGMLMVEAFAPHGLRDLPRYWFVNGVPEAYPDGARLEEEASNAWDDEVNKPFRKRYGLR